MSRRGVNQLLGLRQEFERRSDAVRRASRGREHFVFSARKYLVIRDQILPLFDYPY